MDKIRNFRQQGTPIFYLDETWVNAGHTRQAFAEGLSTGLLDPSGKGKRLIIITHIGNENAFVAGDLLMFESQKT